jgi:hypothetical protein
VYTRVGLVLVFIKCNAKKGLRRVCEASNQELTKLELLVHIHPRAYICGSQMYRNDGDTETDDGEAKGALCR